MALFESKLSTRSSRLGQNRTLAQLQPTATLSGRAVIGGDRSEGPQSALNVEMCMAQHLLLSAHSCLSRRPLDAAVRPVEPDFRALCSIFAG
jgi:hypothetical protein